MNRILWHSSLRYTFRHPWQFGLSVLGISLGVAVVIAIDLSNESALRAFELSTQAIVGKTTHQVLGGPSGLSENVYRRMRVDGGIRQAAPVVEGSVSIPAHGDESFSLLGIDPFAEAPFRPYLSDAEGGVGDAVTALLTQPATVLVSETTAQTMGLSLGDELLVQAAGRAHKVIIAGLLHPRERLQARALDELLITDISTAQELLHMLGDLSRIDLIIPNDVLGEKTLTQVEALLPPGATIIEASARSDTATQMTRAFNLNLVMLSLLALIVGMFLIYNTMTFSVVQRRSLIGNLRVLGVTRGQIFALLLAEACVVGLVGTLVGLVLGVALAQGLVKLVTQTINDLYFVLNVQDVTVSVTLLCKGLAMGLGAVLLAASFPALEATRVTPAVALARSAIEARVHRRAPQAAVAGASILVLGSVWLLIPNGTLEEGFAILFCVVAGFTLLAPGITIVLVRILRGMPASFVGSLASMSVRGVEAGLSRTGVAISALMVALATTVGVSIMVDSFRQSVGHWLETTLQADIYVAAPDMSRGVTLEPELIRHLTAVRGVAEFSMGRSVRVQSPTGSARLYALSMAPRAYQGVYLIAGDPTTIWPAFERDRAALVTEPYAFRHKLSPGDEVELLTDKGPQRFPVVGVYRDYGSDQGAVLISRDTYEAFWDDRGHSFLRIYAAEGSDIEALIEELERTATNSQAVRIRSNRAIREASLEVFDRTFTITHVLRILATGIAFFGVLSALMALQFERGREIAVLRAQGVTPGQVWGLVEMQTGVMGLIAGLLAMPMGLVMAYVLTLVINRRSFGWSLDMHLDPSILIQSLLIALGAALIAGLYPALKMARTSPALALREE